jgi:adenylate cyclase, class 2
VILLTYEVELKFPVKDMGDIKERLRRLKALYIDRQIQEDIYFNGIIRDFKQTDEALRIRKTDINDWCELTYKGPKFDKQSKTREEIQVDIKNFDALKDILEKLGYNRSIKVRKIRENWQHEGYNIALDEVDSLGLFLELEMVDIEEGHVAAKVNELKAFAIQLGIDPEMQIREGYLDMLESKFPTRV